MHKRLISRFEHPIYSSFGSFLTTDAYEYLHTEITRWLWTGVTGGLVLGQARVGKTAALERLQQDLTLRDQRKPAICYVYIPKRDRKTLTEVWRILCQSGNLRVTNNSKAGVMAQSYKEYLLDLSIRASVSQIVILVDEVQRLSADQLSAFVEIYDDFRQMNIRVMTVLVGNSDESDTLQEQIQQRSQAHLRGRMFCQYHVFYGLRSRAEIENCLAQYDTLRYPEDQGPTYTEQFLPAAYGKGFRLKTLAAPIWNSFKTYKKQYKIEGLGLQFFREVVDTLLIDYLSTGVIDPFSIDPALFDTCFNQSGLIRSCVTATD